ncbi:signal peptidase [Chryseobacterium sp. T1]
MMKTFLKIFTVFFFAVSNLLLAGDPPVPNGPINNGTGTGGGTTGTGSAPDNPIDMYLVWLGIIAIISIFYLAKKNSKRIA